MKRLGYLLLVFFLLNTIGLHAQIVNNWVGVLKVKEMEFELVLHVTQDGNGYKTTMDIPAQNVAGLQAATTTYKDGVFTADFQTALIKITGSIKDSGLLEGRFIQGGFDIPISFKAEQNFESVPRLKKPQDPQGPFNYEIKEVKFYNKKDSIQLAGTLTLPKGIEQPPIAIMISGSGQQNRDEEIFGHKPFWIIADDFAKKGIGVLRYDDRGIGNSSAGKDLNLKTTADFAQDAATALDYLMSLGYKNIGFIGHSEGGMIAPIVAAERKNDVQFIILMAGPGIPCDSLLILQTYLSSVASGVEANVANYNRNFTRSILDYIKSYKGKDLSHALENKIISLLDKDTMTQSLSEEEKKGIIQNTVYTMATPWMQYFLKFEPARYLKKIKCPVLAINGTKDVQVSVTENLQGIEAALKKGKNKNYQIVPISGLNHLFQPAVTGAISEYSDNPVSIDPQVLDLMSQWILKLNLH